MSEETGIPPSDVDAVVVNFNSGDALLGCLASLRAASASRIIVVDNSSKDGSIDAVTSAFPEIEVIRAGRNLGYGSAANRGARLGQAPYLVVSNPDVTVGPDSINRLVETLERATDAAAAGPLISDAEGRPYPSARSFPDFVTGAAHAFVGLFDPDNRWSRRYRAERGAADRGEERECDWVSGAFVVFRRAAFESVGGFDERYFMYVEDLDLCWRLRRAGWRVLFNPESAIVHDQGLSTRQHAYRMLAAHHVSTFRFARKSLSGPKQVLVPVVAVGLLARFCLAVGQKLLARRPGAPPGRE